MNRPHLKKMGVLSRLSYWAAVLLVAVGLTSIVSTPFLAIDIVAQNHRIEQGNTLHHEQNTTQQKEIENLLKQHSVTFKQQQAAAAAQAAEQKVALQIEEYYIQAVQAICAQTHATCPTPPNLGEI